LLSGANNLSFSLLGRIRLASTDNVCGANSFVTIGLSSQQDRVISPGWTRTTNSLTCLPQTLCYPCSDGGLAFTAARCSPVSFRITNSACTPASCSKRWRQASPLWRLAIILSCRLLFLFFIQFLCCLRCMTSGLPCFTQHHGDIPEAKFFIAGRNMNERLRVLGY